MKKLKFFYLLLMIFIAASCAKDQLVDPPGLLRDNANPFNLISPKIKIAVVSDIHYMHPSLLPKNIADSPSLLDYLGKDRKILELSDPIFRKVVSELLIERPDILLIPGDLTKDGELISHLAVKFFLQRLENRGIKVYVIPGNNDIINPDAMSFKNGDATPVENITPEKFRSLYADFGYDEAFTEDENSLSYICKPYKNLWIIGIDNCKYTTDANTGKIKVSGAINPATLAWIEAKMAEARKNKVKVLTMMHYGIIEHYAGQDLKKIEPLISDSKVNAEALMDAGISLIFTGHYHANDIVSYSYDGETLYDIQTGSLVTPPFSYRIMYLDNNFLSIDTRRVTRINSKVPGGVDFLTYCDAAITDRLTSFFTFYLVKMFKLPEQNATFFAPYCMNAWKAYFAGDEKITAEESAKLDALPTGLTPLVTIVKSVWTDLPPKDNKAHIKLK